MRAANLAVSRDQNQLSAAEAARLLWREIAKIPRGAAVISAGK
jgi:hypothetical protein